MFGGAESAQMRGRFTNKKRLLWRTWFRPNYFYISGTKWSTALFSVALVAICEVCETVASFANVVVQSMLNDDKCRLDTN
jgi:hypothetical protein